MYTHNFSPIYNISVIRVADFIIYGCTRPIFHLYFFCVFVVFADRDRRFRMFFSAFCVSASKNSRFKFNGKWKFFIYFLRGSRVSSTKAMGSWEENGSESQERFDYDAWSCCYPPKKENCLLLLGDATRGKICVQRPVKSKTRVAFWKKVC